MSVSLLEFRKLKKEGAITVFMLLLLLTGAGVSTLRYTPLMKKRMFTSLKLTTMSTLFLHKEKCTQIKNSQEDSWL